MSDNEQTAMEEFMTREPSDLPNLNFGDYATIEQKRHGCDNEMYQHKVIGRSKSNFYVDVPVQSPATEILHKGQVDVLYCICCGLDETKVRKYKATDVMLDVLYRK